MPASPPDFIGGGPDFESEVLLAFELGYKVQPAPTLSVSVATFHNRYSKLRSVEGGPPYVFRNNIESTSFGIESAGTWQPSRAWRLSAGYTHLDLHVTSTSATVPASQLAQDGDLPRDQAFVRSSVTPGGGVEFQVSARYVGELPNQQVPSYVAADVRLGWQATSGLELAVDGRNLFDPRHPEFGTPATRREIPRSIFGKVTWRF
jgi:iron complex outermembrane recepter protein